MQSHMYTPVLRCMNIFSNTAILRDDTSFNFSKKYRNDICLVIRLTKAGILLPRSNFPINPFTGKNLFSPML